MQRAVVAPAFDRDEVPPEVRAKPKALIGVFGLDTLNNAVHRLIWETCNAPHVHDLPDSIPILYKLISNSHEFPVVKPKRNSYEWYIPKGILKRNWMIKHLYEIPAVIAIFYELEWDDPQWTERMIECASKVQSIRAAIEGRSTQIVVVLIQDSPGPPVNEDPFTNERAVALCASCELNAKSLFVLPHRDHLQGYILRLEVSLFEMAKVYYYSEVKNIKSHEKLLNRTIHQYLIVRHYFKMGFLNQMGNDNHTAHKNFTCAFNNLTEIRIVDTNATEIRTVGSFINYKLCKILFLLGLPRDAIAQFKTHMDMYKLRVGFQELAFEHHMWMSQQYSIFADTFEEAVKAGLPAVQTQHPGIYYQQAAEQAILRKKACQELCKDVKEYPSPDPLEHADHMEFYGQRPWRPGKLNTEPPNPQVELRGMQALQYLEKQVNHSKIIISLYDLAIGQYKRYKCPRMRRVLAVQMADEYFNCGDFGTALILYCHMLTDYGTERWYLLISNILCKAINCAYLAISLQDFLALSFKVLSPLIKTSVEYKEMIYNNIQAILQEKIPKVPVKTPHEPTALVTLWQQELSKSPNNVTLEVGTNDIVSSVDAKVRFVEVRYQIDQTLEIELFVKSSCPFPLEFSRMTVTVGFPDNASNELEVRLSEQATDFRFSTNEARKFLIEFNLTNPNDVGKMMQINSVNLYLGMRGINFKFTGLGLEWKISPELIHFRRENRSVTEFDKFRPHLVTGIVPRCSKLSVEFEHPEPALLNEWYGVTISVVNDEVMVARGLTIEVVAALEDKGPTEFSSDGKNFTISEKLPLKIFYADSVSPSETISAKFYVRCHTVDPRNVVVKINYTLSSGGSNDDESGEDETRSLSSVKDELLHIPVVDPFQVDVSFSDLRFRDISKFYVGESFIMTPTISCQSSWPVEICSCILEDVDVSFMKVNKGTSPIANMILRGGDSATDVYMVEPLKHSDAPAKIGRYRIKWKRQNGLAVSITEITIMGLSVSWTPLAIELPLPEYGLVRTPLLITYKLYNRSQQLIQLELNMDSCEACMFAGYRQLPISILPESAKVFHYNLYPLLAGNVKLPKLSLVVPEGSTEGPALRQDQLNSLIERTVPTHIFIMPQSRGITPPSQTKDRIDSQNMSKDLGDNKTVAAII